MASADISRRVQYALADDAKIRGLTRLPVLAEHLLRDHRVLKGKPGSYEPGEDAIAAVRSGELRADPGTP